MRRSWQGAGSPVAELNHRENSFHPLAGGRKLPGWEMFYSRIFAFLRLGMNITWDAAFDVWRILKRIREHFLLLRAMRTPVSTVHLRAAAAQAAREGVVLVSAIVVVVVVEASRNEEHHADDSGLFPQTARLLILGSLFLSTRVGHENFLYHDLERR